MSGKIKLIYALFTSFLIVITGCSRKSAVVIGDRDGWHKIAESSVSFEKEREEITLVGSNRFAKLQLFVYDASIDLQDMDIYYENGNKQHVAQLTPLIENRKSKIIDVQGAESSITKVTFVYKTVPNKEKEKGMIQLWGFKTNVMDNNAEKKTDAKEEKKSDAENKNPSTGEVPKTSVVSSTSKSWTRIASTFVDFKKDSDEVKIEGRDHFSRIKIKSLDAAILIDQVVIYYEDFPSTQKIKIPSMIKSGEESSPLQLQFTDKSIYKMVFIYQTVPNPEKERAQVEVWGMK